MVSPKDPFELIEVVPPFWCPKAPNSVLEAMPSHHAGSDRPHQQDAPAGDPPVILTEWKLGWRQQQWDAYHLATLPVQAMHQTLRPTSTAFVMPRNIRTSGRSDS